MDRPYENLVDLCVNSAMASLRNTTNDQLEQILNDDVRIDSIIDALPQVLLDLFFSTVLSVKNEFFYEPDIKF